MNCEEIPGWENSLSDAALMLSKAGGGLRSVDNTQVVPDLNESTLSGDIQMMSLECQTLLPEDLTKERSYSVGSLTSWKSCSSLTSGYQSDDTHSSTLSSPKYLCMDEDLPSSSGGSTLLNLDGISSPNVQESLGPTAEGDSSSGADWMFYSPLIWTKAQVQSWLRWAWQQCNIPGEYDLGNLDLTGPELCVATMEELQNRSEHGGLLYEAFTKLDIPQWECK